MAVLANSTNGFGYRSDDHGNTIGQRDRVDPGGQHLEKARGSSGATRDVDMFSFTVTTQGTYRLAVNVAAVGPNLDTVLNFATRPGR